jgi:hypothetical protein
VPFAALVDKARALIFRCIDRRANTGAIVNGALRRYISVRDDQRFVHVMAGLVPAIHVFVSTVN